MEMKFLSVGEGSYNMERCKTRNQLCNVSLELEVQLSLDLQWACVPITARSWFLNSIIH